MGILSDVKKFIFEEEVRYKAGVSEAVARKMGQTMNFLAHRLYSEKNFYLNGRYRVFNAQNGIDGLTSFPYDAEIFSVMMFNLVAGSGGTTELDIKRATASGGSFSSIFSTTPKIASSAGNNAFIFNGGTVTGCTAPVLSSSPFNVDAEDVLRVDCVSVQTGNPENCGIVIFYRPR